MAEVGAPDESSDSEPEQEPGTPQKLIRKVSTSGQIRSKTVLKEGNLMKQTNSFQRWKRRYFKLRGRTLYYAQTSKVSRSTTLRWRTRLCPTFRPVW
ncbi:diacylglycerol kinase delta-like [Anarrhichthys ocellatus]|uniref:diacylglycerol kinase delta-like n=1 Tax=Anarrhichthys ocellatus TaxID=433405 RepID=UPI0012ED7744|nr:diacylglycerol kinase delta-like [Anarrhichthys ocellatus]XP_031698251.1 diacylglycerol kinase delta-like [Anarrhichthys ocellatus]